MVATHVVIINRLIPSLLKMGNGQTKQGDYGQTCTTTKEENEANRTLSRHIQVYFYDDVKMRAIHEHDTAHELLETCCGNQHKNYEVVLHCNLNKQIVLQVQDEISDYWDDVESIHIVLVGTGQNNDVDNSLLDPALKLRTK